MSEGNASYVGDIASAVSGEVGLYSIPFSSRLLPGETISSALAKMTVWPTSPEQDENAPNLILGPPSAANGLVQVPAGGLGTSGFQLAVVYALYAWATTSLGRTLIGYGTIPCDPIAPPTVSGSSSLPSNSEQISVNTTASTSTIYLITEPGITFTLPPTWMPGLGAVTIVDLTGEDDPQITIEGPVGNITTPVTIHQSGFAGTFAFASASGVWVQQS